MSLVENITNDMKQAMKARAELQLSVLRMLLAALKNKKIELKSADELTDEQAVQVVKSEIKKRRDAITSYTAGKRDDLANKEKSELSVLEQYMPAQMSKVEIESVVKEIVSQMEDVKPSDFGRVMGQVMGRTKGQADGTVVSEAVKKVLHG